MKSKLSKSAGIKEIARTLGVSIGTVDRALHSRPGISPETQARVLKTAEKMNYRPNVAARSLKLNRDIRVAVHLPEHISSFFDPLREGIRAAAAPPLGLRIDLDFHTYPRLGEGDVELLEANLARDYDGLIVTVGSPRRIDPLLRQLALRRIPVICVASDAPYSPRLASVSVDGFISGSIAAELLAMTSIQDGSVAVITGDLSTQDHAEKLRGFAATLAVMGPHLHLLAAVESHERAEDAYCQTMNLLNRNSRPNGIYISTANSLPVLKVLEELELLGRVQVITTDFFPELIPLIESGSVLATLHQRPFTQGKIAFEALIRYIVEHSSPTVVTKLAPHIVLRSNLPLFSRQM